MERIIQEHKNGCVVAALAMVVSCSYQDLHDILAPRVWWHSPNEAGEYEWHQGIDFNQQAICVHDGMRWLERRGWATQTRYRYEFGHAINRQWPPTPFAPAHICTVETTHGTQHAMVMDVEGKLLDPYYDDVADWSFYKQVYSVVGCWRVIPGNIRTWEQSLKVIR